jgi:hypothetical protein
MDTGSAMVSEHVILSIYLKDILQSIIMCCLHLLVVCE